MHRERNPVERLLSRLLIVSLLAAQLPLATLANASDSDDALQNSDKDFGFNFGTSKDPAAVPLPQPRPASADATKGTNGKDGAPGTSDAPAGDTGTPDKAAAAAKKDDNSVKSPIGLCDGDDKTETAKPGYGAPVAKWPPPGTPELQKKIDAFIKERASVSVNSESANHVHKSFPGNQESRPDLSPSIAARQRFFDVAFGLPKDSTFGPATEAICESKVMLGQKMAAFAAKITAPQGAVDICSGADKQVYELYDKTQKAYQQYSDYVDHFLHGFTGRMAGKDVKFPSLEKEFLENRHKNLDNINLYKPPATEQRPVKVSDATWKLLRSEFDMLWGKGSVDRASGDKQIDTTGLYSNMLLQTRREKANADEQLKNFKKQNEAILARAKKCGFGADAAQVKPQQAAVKPHESDVTKASSKQSDTTGASAPVKTAGDAAAKAAEAASTAANDDATIKTHHHGNDDDDSNDNSNVANHQPQTPETPETPPPATPPAAQPSAAGQFLKNNWMWLAGGAVLAGGGYLYYRKYKKDQREKAYWQDDSNFLPPPPPPAPAGSTTGTAAPGSHFNFVSSVSGPGGIGQSMGPIGITVTDGNGVVQNVSGVITLSCAAPSPCSISGGTSAQLVSGQATFTGVTFSQPDQNVLLQVSGAGLPNATAPSSFNVGGSTATNPRY